MRLLRLDFRSDTVTQPTLEMLKFMIKCQVGDNVINEDPTVLELEQRMATISGKEAALFMPTGTMSNQVAIRTLLKQPPYSLVADSNAHVSMWESNALAMNSGVKVNNTHGQTLAEVKRAACLVHDHHLAPTRLICLENTINGRVLPLAEIQDISKFAIANNLQMHLDGARLWNAAVQTGVPLAEWCKFFDSVALCFSKGMGCPIGSILVGSTSFIEKAKYFRKIYGGGWRQAGYLAGACIYSLENYVPRLKLDHQRASNLAQRLIAIGVDAQATTNMVWVKNVTEKQLLSLAQNGVSVFPRPLLRFVIHRHHTDESIDTVVSSFAQTF